MFKRAHAHKGATFIEIFQNCIVYNDEVFADFTAKSVAKDEQLFVEHGKPMIYGKESNKGLRVKPGTFEIEAVTIGENGITEADLLVHDETNRTLATILANLPRPEFPVVLGVLFAEDAPVYEDAVHAQIDEIAGEKYSTDIDGLLRAGRTWTVE
jgi:2-oxoglutarate ferredoxin oxidoreductase subunit beta